MKTKSALSSKTLWVNGLTALASGLTLVLANAGSLDGSLVTWIVFVLASVNMVLRFLTTTSIEGGPLPQETPSEDQVSSIPTEFPK